MRLIGRGNLGEFNHGLDPNVSLVSFVLRVTALL